MINRWTDFSIVRLIQKYSLVKVFCKMSTLCVVTVSWIYTEGIFTWRRSVWSKQWQWQWLAVAVSNVHPKPGSLIEIGSKVHIGLNITFFFKRSKQIPLAKKICSFQYSSSERYFRSFWRSFIKSCLSSTHCKL